RQLENGSWNRCFHVRGRFRSERRWGHGEREQTLNNSSKSSHRRLVDQDEVHEWTIMKNLTFACASIRAGSCTSLSIVSKNSTQRNATAGSLLLFRPDLVVAQLPHEYFLVYGPPGVIEHRRDASRAANFRALPGNDDQRRRRFLIAQDGHSQRLSSRDGG